MKSTQQRWAGKKKIKVTWALGEQVPPLSAIREEQLKFTPLCSFPTVITATLEGTLIDNLTAIPISSSTNLACVDAVHRTVYIPYEPPGVLAITRTLCAEIGSGRRFSFCKEHWPVSDPVQIERPSILSGLTHVALSSSSWLTDPSTSFSPIAFFFWNAIGLGPHRPAGILFFLVRCRQTCLSF